MEYQMDRITSYNVCYTKLLRAINVFRLNMESSKFVCFVLDSNQIGVWLGVITDSRFLQIILLIERLHPITSSNNSLYQKNGSYNFV